MCLYVCASIHLCHGVFVCVHACVCKHACVCMRVCVSVRTHVLTYLKPSLMFLLFLEQSLLVFLFLHVHYVGQLLPAQPTFSPSTGTNKIGHTGQFILNNTAFHLTQIPHLDKLFWYLVLLKIKETNWQLMSYAFNSPRVWEKHWPRKILKVKAQPSRAYSTKSKIWDPQS